MTNSNFVTAMIGMPDFADTDYDYFKEEFKKLAGIQLHLYKEKQMKRRINTLILRKGMDNYKDYITLLQSDQNELRFFIDYITINVTEFFRTPDHWKYLEDFVLTDLVRHTSGKLKIWSCACSTGEEAYSLAMSLFMLCPTLDFQVIATDIDDAVLSKAKRGLYDERAIAAIPEKVKEQFFLPDNSHWSVIDVIREHILFQKMDLLQDAYPSDCDLIVCRNVLIYFTEEAKEKIYRELYQSLRSGGYLFTGNTEQIIYYKKTGFQKVKNFLYQKQ